MSRPAKGYEAVAIAEAGSRSPATLYAAGRFFSRICISPAIVAFSSVSAGMGTFYFVTFTTRKLPWFFRYFNRQILKKIV